MPETGPPSACRTEAEMIGLLEGRYRGESGNGPAWAFVPKVRNAAGFGATGTCDGIAMALWPSRGLELHGHEVKVSRSDWLRELKKPHKAETFIVLCDRWWIVAADSSIVRLEELPTRWGLLVAQGTRLVQKRPAELLPPISGAPPFTAQGKSFLAALLRSAARTHAVTPAEVEAAVTLAIEQHREYAKRKLDERDKTIADLRERLDVFARESGVALGSENGHRWSGARPASEVGAALKLVLTGEADVERFRRRLETQLEMVERLRADLERALPSKGETS